MGPSEFVKSLGSTADEVAESLRRLGVKGRRRSRCECPIAVAVNKHAPGWGGIRVSGSGYLSYNDVQIMDPQTTSAVQAFVRAFDDGSYPYLVSGC
jgi:hypothetical protein